MSLLQLVGGVAAAGVVAAGTTAFTGGGLTNSITGSKSFIGGTVDHQIVGATLTNLTFVTTDTTDPLGTHVTSFKLTFDNNTPSGSVVTISGLSGTADSSNSPDNFYCSNVATVSSAQVSTCTAGTSLSSPAGYFTNVGSFSIKVV